MKKHRIFATAFASVYPHYVNKVEAKGRTKQELHEVICWLTGYTPNALVEQIETRKDFEASFAEAPALHPHVTKNHRCHLRRTHRGHRGSADAEPSVSRQVGG